MAPNLTAVSSPAELVREFCCTISSRDFDKIAVQLAADANWTVVGRPDRFAFGGTQSKAKFLEGIRATWPTFDQFQFDVLSLAQNGDVVFVEARAEGRGPGAARYSNHYLMRFIIRDGLVVDVLEHYDPFEALAYVEQLSE